MLVSHAVDSTRELNMLKNYLSFGVKEAVFQPRQSPAEFHRAHLCQDSTRAETICQQIKGAVLGLLKLSLPLHIYL